MRARYVYLILFVLVAIGAWTGWWFYLAGEVRTRTNDWITAQAAQGVEVAYTDFQVGGYPYRIEIEIDNLTVSAPRQPGRPAAAVPHVTVLGLPWNPNLVIASITGPSEFRWTDAKGVEQRATATAASAGLSVGLERGQPQRLALSLADFRLVSTTAPEPITAKVFEIHARRQAGGAAPAADGGSGQSPTAPLAVEVAIDGENIHMAATPDQPLGPDIERLALTLGLAGPLPRLVPGTAPRELVAAWAQAGGTLEITRAETKWASLDLTMTGSFSVDSQMRPIGATSGRIGGLEPLIDGAVARGRISDGQASSIKQALNAIGFIARDAQGRVPVAINIQDGRIMFGPVPVGQVGPIF
ncbi:DUF2125 domain-containing protein [Oleomonas cavernae]|uniref:DUF2125 domain-containing protein n=1 Tax=Oleomonas cavernae TaxID=2320859 RepID=UPI001314C15C|nr:DUF2125 domain-containing protein [Oleomonas cavernae]